MSITDEQVSAAENALFGINGASLPRSECRRLARLALTAAAQVGKPIEPAVKLSIDDPKRALPLARFLCEELYLEIFDEISRPKYIQDAVHILTYLSTQTPHEGERVEPPTPTRKEVMPNEARRFNQSPFPNDKTSPGSAPDTPGRADDGPFSDMTADELRHISRKLSTYAHTYTGDKEARRMSRRCWEVAAVLDEATRCTASPSPPAQSGEGQDAIPVMRFESELEAELRSYVVAGHNPDGSAGRFRPEICERAADRIATLTQELAEANLENTRLRAALAQSSGACVYCSLSKEDWAKCQHGFPGCDRADDAMGCPELGASLELAEAEKVIERAAIYSSAARAFMERRK